MRSISQIFLLLLLGLLACHNNINQTDLSSTKTEITNEFDSLDINPGIIWGKSKENIRIGIWPKDSLFTIYLQNTGDTNKLIWAFQDKNDIIFDGRVSISVVYNKKQGYNLRKYLNEGTFLDPLVKSILPSGKYINRQINFNDWIRYNIKNRGHNNFYLANTKIQGYYHLESDSWETSQGSVITPKIDYEIPKYLLGKK